MSSSTELLQQLHCPVVSLLTDSKSKLDNYAKMSEDYYREFFERADVDGSGCLTEQELIDMLKNNGYKGDDDTIKSYFNTVDFTGDNKISMDEYLAAMGQLSPKEHKVARLRSLFRDFDKDGSGLIDRSELDAVFDEAGKHFSEDELQRMIQQADQDASGTLNYDEFVEYVFG